VKGDSLKTTRASFQSHTRPLLVAVVLSIALSLLFVAVYGGCNALAERNADCKTYFWSWELSIPFVPVLIVPYMSLDAFFVASFLLCPNKRLLHAHARRIAFAILSAGLVFLLFPLTTGYPRPVVEGWSGNLFNFLWSFDRPHNLVPSLHVVLTSLLWPLYARTERRSIRTLIHVWFALIILSPLLTWQHHVIDVVSGALLAQLSMFLFPDEKPRRLIHSSRRYLRPAFWYAAGSLLFVLLSFRGSAFILLLWPALSLALVASSYIRGSSLIFRKRDGKLPLSTWIVLGPYLLGARVSWWIYRRKRTPWIEIAPNVFRGRLLTNREAGDLINKGVTAVLDLTAEYPETKTFRGLQYLNVPILDLTKPSDEQLRSAIEFLESHTRSGSVYVHCALGVSRSPSLTAAFLAVRNRNSIDVPAALTVLA